MKKTIIFTGGGSGGHVVPALSLIEGLRERGYRDIHYIGSQRGIEREWVEQQGIPYHPVSTGKLRRYWSVENLLDMARLFRGFLQAFIVLAGFKRRGTLLFSTGGFVAVPAILAAWLGRKKIYLHEQTSRAGLANRIGAVFADRIFVTFESSKKFFPAKKVCVSGYPLREECHDDKIGSRVFGGIDLSTVEQPILLVTGGGNGSRLINEKVRDSLDGLLEKYFVVHQVGAPFEEEYRRHARKGYLPVGLVKEGMVDLYKMAHIVLSRAGAGTVCELMALGKRSIFIPLAIAQKNEQYHNAREAGERLGSLVVEEKDFMGRGLAALLESFEREPLPSRQKKPGDVGGRDFLLDEVEKSLNHL